MTQERASQIWPDPTSSFAFLDFEPEGSSLPAADPGLSVKHSGFWSYGGPFITQIDELPPEFFEWADATLSGTLLPRLMPLLTNCNEVVRKRGLDHYWFTIRATKPMSEFDTPRWHTDDLFFSSLASKLRSMPWQPPERSQDSRLDLRINWKLCATLLGPATKFIQPERQHEARERQRAAWKTLATDHHCTSIRCVACGAAADAIRERLAVELEPMGAIQAAPRQCTWFRIGHDDGAVHSEPAMSHGDRIFVNVVPGTKDELKTLFSRWAMEFPRSWWLAPTVARRLETFS
ncbi:hypothetical protein F5Y17DRAFT_358996 [Xylariaceae sp. FL0594]|nr:hypothetical protein F5Y17DRAFT_358996 [Xylariaceae sp. FL0594]